MPDKPQKTPWIWRSMRWLNPHAARNIRRGFGPASMVLLLTTTGRKSGLPRETPLQFEEWDGLIYIGSVRGAQADWFRNIQADPHVEIEIGGRRSSGLAEAVVEPDRIADFLQMRLERHPWMIGLLMRLEGLPLVYKRPDLERFARGKALVVIRQCREQAPASR
jgi:deazaflavin-dependent oxidoreductase (nitroreductase family)